MKILFLVPYVPNLIRVRPYNLIKHLSARGHAVTLLTLWTSESEREDLNKLQDICSEVRFVHLPRVRSLSNCLAALPTRAPLQSVYCWQPELAAGLLELAQPAEGKPDYDILHIEHLRGSRYGLYLNSMPVNGRRRLPVVWDSVDSISLLFKQAAVQSKSWLSRWLTRLEYHRTEPYERWLSGQFDRVLITSEQDKRAILNGQTHQTGPASVSVLPNGVDLDYFRPDDAAQRDPATLVISGKMSYHANVTMAYHFVQEIMPLVWKYRPDVKVTVVGKDPPREILALGRNPAVQVTGTVKDIRPYLQKAALSVVPMRYGAGIQNKVLEAMACGTPVVSTPQAVSALSAQPGRDVLIAEGSQRFAQVVLEALDDPAQQRRIGEAGRRYVEANHNWDEIACQLEDIYDQCIFETRKPSNLEREEALVNRPFPI